MDESTCIHLARHGDKAAYERLVILYQKRLLAFLWNMLGSFDDARDVCQEAFVQAYLHLDAFDPGQGFKPWLFRIAANRAIDHLRQRKLQSRLAARGRAPALPVERGVREAQMLEESLLFFPLLKKVSERERAVLALKFNEGCTSAEIAALLDLSEVTVRVHLYNAKRKLKKELARSGYATRQPVSEEGS